jgi:hypothetical protein
MYPSPKSISVQDAIVVTCFGKIFIKMETTEPQQNASAIPVKNLKTILKLLKRQTQIFRSQIKYKATKAKLTWELFLCL